MSKKKRNRKEDAAAENSAIQLGETKSADKTGLFLYLKTHLSLVGIICFLVLGTLGAGLKYLDEDAQREVVRRANNKGYLNNQPESFLNKINPFLTDPLPDPTPQLSKEYIYAGSRLLAVEDANANVTPPADLAIWRPSTGYWWVMKPDGSVQASIGWGVSTDDPVEGDYDGDGKTDFAVYRKVSGQSSQWWIMRSSDNSYFSTNFGLDTDIPAQTDYDGDGRTDAALFRPSTGVWYIIQSSDLQTVQEQFGLSSDVPAPADYDGDGKADVAVWRPSDTKFYSRNSSNQAVQYPLSFGQSGVPVSADYDGDGKANYAIRSGNNWLILNNSLSQVQSTPWQAGTDAVQNDYDGDGKVDIAIFNAGTWTIRNSSDNSTRTVQWGMSGDTPVPAYYRR